MNVNLAMMSVVVMAMAVMVMTVMMMNVVATMVMTMMKIMTVMMLLMMMVLLSLAAVASAAVRGGAIPLLACAETRVLALTSPVIELWFCFRISCRAALCKNVLTSTFCIVVFGVFLCVCIILHRFLQYFCRLSTFCTCRLGLAFLFQLCLGGGGVMTSMRMRLLFSLPFVHVLVRYIVEAAKSVLCNLTLLAQTHTWKLIKQIAAVIMCR